MNKTLSTILIVLTIIVLAGVIFFAGTMYARANMMWGWSGDNGYRRGMMGQGGMMNGMMNGNGGMMGGMMNGYGYTNSDLKPLTIDDAKAAGEEYLSNLDGSNFTIGEVMIFDNHAYLVIEEKSTGLGAFELLVDPASRTAYPEHGPNMMWNLKYSGLNHQSMMVNKSRMMGMMSGSDMTLAPGASAGVSGKCWSGTDPADVSVEMTVTLEQAMEYAQKYLDENVSGALATSPIQFYGYYTLDFEKDGDFAGMLGVNGFSGQVFLHTWHGTFVEEAE